MGEGAPHGHPVHPGWEAEPERLHRAPKPNLPQGSPGPAPLGQARRRLQGLLAVWDRLRRTPDHTTLSPGWCSPTAAVITRPEPLLPRSLASVGGYAASGASSRRTWRLVSVAAIRGRGHSACRDHPSHAKNSSGICVSTASIFLTSMVELQPISGTSSTASCAAQSIRR